MNMALNVDIYLQASTTKTNVNIIIIIITTTTAIIFLSPPPLIHWFNISNIRRHHFSFVHSSSIHPSRAYWSHVCTQNRQLFLSFIRSFIHR